MQSTSRQAHLEGPTLPAELRLHILSLLQPNDLALGGRLSCKDVAQHYTKPKFCTVHLSQPLPDHVISAGLLDSAQAALRQLTFQQKLQLPANAAASSCEANVEFALQLLQPHVFPELLRSDRGYAWAFKRSKSKLYGGTLPPIADVGSAAVASGLAHLLPSLAQRCPALLDPGRTLEAAARHCDLAGLQAAWGLVGQWLLSSIGKKKLHVDSEDDDDSEDKMIAEQQQALQRIMAEAAASPTPDAISKMAWVLDTCSAHARWSLLCGAQRPLQATWRGCSGCVSTAARGSPASHCSRHSLARAWIAS